MSDDLLNDPEVLAWMEDARVNLIPLIAESDAVTSLVPSKVDDVKYAVELGLSIMLDKPIIAVVLPGRSLPPKMAKVADYVLHMTDEEIHSGEGVERIRAVMEELLPDEDDT